MYPLYRNRRIRTSAAMRDLVRETTLTANDFMVPLFIIEGTETKTEIPSMPDYFRFSLDLATAEAKRLYDLGIRGVLLFVKVADAEKDNTGLAALNPDGLMQRSIRAIKKAVPELVVATDVALDPFSSYGHDGIVKDDKILNDATVAVLTKMALSHAECGANIVAPSDMMDGRVLAIRQGLEKAGYVNTVIMGYSAKYASGFYGPFRDALDSAPGFGDKKTYQMDVANRKEALVEAARDVEEGADIVMVKPGMAYLDIVRDLANEIQVPIAVYQVSGEYAMLKAAAEKGWLDHDTVMLEQLMAFKRAGASIIISYHAEQALKLL
ncbi:MAG: porphobilinogen synthase [Flavobacteriales bacterium]|nr:MAG: porphobilinogen synthase [Flavobacteriales bacterium]